MPIYICNHPIIAALEKTQPGVGGEIQLTDAIQQLINNGFRVQAVKLKQRNSPRYGNSRNLLARNNRLIQTFPDKQSLTLNSKFPSKKQPEKQASKTIGG